MFGLPKVPDPPCALRTGNALISVMAEMQGTSMALCLVVSKQPTSTSGGTNPGSSLSVSRHLRRLTACLASLATTIGEVEGATFVRDEGGGILACPSNPARGCDEGGGDGPPRAPGVRKLLSGTIEGLLHVLHREPLVPDRESPVAKN